VSRWLLDTGPVVAYLDGRDAGHQIVRTTLDRRGFSTFRTEAGRALRLVLDLRSQSTSS
jgi:hypothetical protein